MNPDNGGRLGLPQAPYHRTSNFFGSQFDLKLLMAFEHYNKLVTFFDAVTIPFSAQAS
ncbi:MAG: hypothetical protein ACI9V8_000454 [Urechidicola sp.]|jgi:hypothetical protein